MNRSAENYLKIIADFSMVLIEQTTLDEVVWEMAKYVSHALGFYDCVIYLYDEKNHELVQKSAFGPKNPYPYTLKKPFTLPLGVGIVGDVAKTMKGEIVNDTSIDPRYVVDDEIRLSEIAVPIVFEGKLIGVIDSEHPEKNFYNEEQLKILQIIASMSATKIMQARMFDFLKIQTQKLKISNDRLLQFYYIASHDLGSPVKNITALLSLLDYSMIKGDNLLILENIKSASQKLQGTLQNLIELVADENSLHKFKETVDFQKMLSEVTQSIMKQIEESKAVIKSNFEVKEIKYPGVYMHSILLNFITNAIKYKSAKRAPVISISTRMHEKFVCLTIKDNGKGIDLEKNRLKLFNRLQRFDQEIEGKGLGLYLVKTQVEALDGKIEVESELNRGTAFHVYLSPQNK